MSGTFEDSVLDFDINLFQHSSNNALVQSNKDKVRKAIFLTKRKVMSTDSLIRKYYDKRLSFCALERCLLTSKEEYKQACIENMEYQEKLSALQDEIKKLHALNRELEEKYVAADNRHNGMQSHAKQLQILVKQNETTIESLKIDHQLEKANSKEVEKKCIHLQGENEYLVKKIHSISDIVLGKKKLSQEIRFFLMKYKKSDSDNDCDSEEVSCEEPDTFNDSMSPLSDSGACDGRSILATSIGENNNKIESKLRNIDENEEIITRDDIDSECSNEVVSLDTGRGSSLAFSDSDKCFNSPEYYSHHSPLNSDVIRNKDKVTVDVATSPMPIREFANIATSPVIFYENTHTDKDEYEKSETVLPEKRNENSTPVIMIDRVVSPIVATQYVNASTSPVRNLTTNAATSPVNLGSSTQPTNYGIDHSEKEKECLELNNMGTLEDDSSDSEIQMILHTMRFNKELITPIPTTPAKSRNLGVSSNNATQTTWHSDGCPDAAKLREDNSALQATVAKLAQEVLNINNFLIQFKTSVKRDDIVCTKGTPEVLGSKCNMEPTEGLQPEGCNQKNDALIISHSHETTDNIMKDNDSFNSKMSKLVEKNILLFDDPSLPSASGALPAAPADIDYDNIDINDHESTNNLKSKERFHFEDPPLNQGLVSDDAFSDHEVYESEIVIELTPDSHESDRHTLHELLKKQTEQKYEENPNKTTQKVKKLTKLEKLRKRMLPKSKIKNVDVQTKRKRRIQPIRFKAYKDRITKANCLMNNRAAFERACKVMSEIKAKEKADNSTVCHPRTRSFSEKGCQKISTTMETSNTDLLNNNDDDHRSIHSLNENAGVKNNVIKSAQKSQSQVIKTPSKVGSTVETEISDGDIDSFDQNVTPKISRTTPTSRDYTIINLPVQKIIRTCSQSKSFDHNDVVQCNLVTRKPGEIMADLQKTEVTGSNLCNQTSTLKMYGINRSKRRTEDNFTNNCKSVINSPIVQTDADKTIIRNTQLQSEMRKRLKRPSDDKPEVATKRILRSSSVLSEVSNHSNQIDVVEKDNNSISVNDEIVTYDDLDIFDSSITVKRNNDKIMTRANFSRRVEHPKFGILCRFLDRYAIKSQKATNPKISENETNCVCQKLEDDIAEIQKLPPNDAKPAMDTLVQHLQGWTTKHLLSGLIKYLKEPNRKIESFNKICIPPAPPMTKAEQILIYIVAQLKISRPNIVNNLLDTIEYTLFMLNRTPEFEVIETLSHFYAVMCRYEKNKNRLRQFVIDAMYCLQFKSVPLIRQCLEVWFHVLPLAHMGIAKTPLVMCLVYLLHFYKCVDRFNRVQDIRNILHRKYFYEMSEWNETRILEMFRNAIIELRDIPVEKKMLRIALIILAKRHGARWCQNNIIKNMLQPIIEDPSVAERIKAFCVSLLGPLIKPYPVEMKVNCEIIMNQLLDMLKRNPSHQMEEAIFTSLLFMSKLNQTQVIRALLFWNPESISPEFEELLRNYVRERNAKSWKIMLSKISIHQPT